MTMNDYSIQRIEELYAEINQLKERLSRYEGDNVITVQVWQREDIEVALADNGFEPSDENINHIISLGIGKVLGDCTYGNEAISDTVTGAEENLTLKEE